MTDKQLRDILNQELAKFTGQLSQSFNTRIDGLRDELKGDIGHVQQSVDGIASRLDVEEQERAAVQSQLDRHDRWHHQAADKLGMKLDHQEP